MLTVSLPPYCVACGGISLILLCILFLLDGHTCWPRLIEDKDPVVFWLRNFSECDSVTDRWWTSQFPETVVVSVLSLGCLGVFGFSYFDFVCLFWWGFVWVFLFGFWSFGFVFFCFFFKADCKYC